MVPYREILDAFEDRTEKGLLQKILDDSKHRWDNGAEIRATTTWNLLRNTLELQAAV